MTKRRKNTASTLAQLLFVGGEPWSTAQAAERLCCTARTVVKMIKRGELLAVKLSGAYVLFPWQFNQRGGGVFSSIQAIVRILRERSLSTENIVRWLLEPLKGNPRSGNRLNALLTDEGYPAIERAAQSVRRRCT